MRAVDLVPPMVGRGPAHEFWSIVSHAQETGAISKTSEFDQSSRFDLPRQQFLGPAVEARLEERFGDAWRHGNAAKAHGAGTVAGSLFGVTQDEVARDFKRAALALRLDLIGPPHAYQLRHGGASHDAATSSRSLAGIRKRGFWRSEKSVRRYEKGSRLTEYLSRLPVAIQQHLVECAAVLPDVLACRAFPLAPVATRA